MKTVKLVLKGIFKPIALLLYNQILSAKLCYPRYTSLDIAIQAGYQWRSMLNKEFTIDTLSVDLGCGARPRNPFMAVSHIGVDINVVDRSSWSCEADQTCESIILSDISGGKLPFSDNSVEYITAFDFFEHLSRSSVTNSPLNPVLILMNEIYRVLAKGGVFLSYTPAFPFEVAFSDPTHQNIVTEATFPYYFCIPPSGVPWARTYGFNGELFLLTQYWLHDHLVTVIGRK